jgi:hypothetical protein
MGPVLPDLLRAVVARLATAKLPSFIQVCRALAIHGIAWVAADVAQSLVMPFAYLFSTEHTAQTIQLLSQFSVPAVEGGEKSALEVVLSAWCETSETVSGSWNIRVRQVDLSFLHLISALSPLRRVRW